MTSTKSPAGTYNYSYDEMGRLSGMADGDQNPVASATYGVAGELLSLWTDNGAGGGTTETRTYNSLMQMTRQTVTGANAATPMDLEYRYPTGQNNGRITQAKDYVSGEEVTYTYDALQRLVKAETTGSGGWGTAYGYDGFGNL